MTEQELRDKVIEIAISTVWKDCYGDEVVIDRAVAEQFADALIDANIFVDIGTLKDEQQSMNGILTNMSSYMNYKLHELEHRAEVAEKELLVYKEVVGAMLCEIDCFNEGYCPEFYKDPECENCIKKKIYGNSAATFPCLLDKYIQQAEKELAEEGGGGKGEKGFETSKSGAFYTNCCGKRGESTCDKSFGCRKYL